MSDALNELGAHVEARRPDCVLSWAVARGELTLEVSAASLVSFVEFLKSDRNCRFSTLVDITAVDYPEREARFDVVYHFLSMYENQRIRLKVAAREDDMLPSITDIHPSANWFEREGVRHVRHSLQGAPRPAPHPHRLRVPRPSAPEGLPDHGLYRGALRRRGKAGGLRAGEPSFRNTASSTS